MQSAHRALYHFSSELPGRYLMQIPWQPPQTIDVRQVGSRYVFEFRDRLGRRAVVEGERLGYHVTVFRARSAADVTRFVVYGAFRSVTYRAFDGQETAVLIYGRA